MEVTFQVTSHEGSVIVSCAASFEVGLIQPHRDLDDISDSGSLIYSKVDPLVKQKYNKSVPVFKLSDNIRSREVQAKCKQQQCQALVHTLFSDKNCQETKYVHMHTMQSSKENSSYTWSMPRPVKLQSASKQKCPVRQQYVGDGKQSQSTKFIKSGYGD